MRWANPLGAALALALGFALAPAACRQTVYIEYDGSLGGSGGGNPFDGGDGGPSSGFCAGGQTHNVQFSNAPDVIVALDRSASMATTPFATSTRLDQALTGLYQVIQRYQTTVRFGYVGFPGTGSSGCSNGQSCCASDVMYPTTNGYDAFRFATTCDPTSPFCATTSDRPTDAALQGAFSAYNMFDLQSRNRFVLLVTDGEPMCGPRSECGNAESEVAMLSNSPTRVDTVVIGIGDGGATCLQQLALSGGRQLQNAPYYHHVSTGSDLQDALSSVVSDLAHTACWIDITSPLSNPDHLGVSIDGVAVPHNMYDGWDYQGSDKSTIKLSQTWCDLLLSSDSGALRLQSCTIAQP